MDWNGDLSRRGGLSRFHAAFEKSLFLAFACAAERSPTLKALKTPQRLMWIVDWTTFVCKNFNVHGCRVWSYYLSRTVAVVLVDENIECHGR